MNVWDAIEDSPSEAENMKLRGRLMMALETHIRAKSWTQSEAAARLGVSQLRISDLLRGKISLLALDTLVNMTVAAELKIDITVTETA